MNSVEAEAHLYWAIVAVIHSSRFLHLGNNQAMLIVLPSTRRPERERKGAFQGRLDPAHIPPMPKPIRHARPHARPDARCLKRALKSGDPSRPVRPPLGFAPSRTCVAVAAAEVGELGAILGGRRKRAERRRDGRWWAWGGE